jgi:hypothetical protein
MTIKLIKHVEMDMEQSDQGKGIIVGSTFTGLIKMSREVIDRV